MSKKRFESGKDTSPFVAQKSKLKDELSIREIKWTENQQKIVDAILDKNTSIVLVDACAGTGKSLIGCYAGLKLLSEKRVGEAVYIRTIIESASKSLGSLPGEFENKFEPFIGPLRDKLEELLKPSDINKLFQEERIKAIPVNYLRGRSFAVTYLYADEVQNFQKNELITLLTRVAKFSKLVLMGDSFQSDINGKSGFKEIFNIFSDKESQDNGVKTFTLDKSDILRSDICRFIITKLESSINGKLKN